ncbi:MAG TPA: SpoIID/LytB domain-containing protein [Anaeromyxobacter sp.]
MRRAALLALVLSSCATGRGPSTASAATAAAPDPDAEVAVTATAAPEPEVATSTAPPASTAGTEGPPPEGATTAAPPPAPLPPPLPTPEPPPLVPPAASDLADPLDVLWGHRLDFSSRGEPLVSIRLMEGQREITFRSRGAARVVLRGGGVVEIPAGARLTVRARRTAPAAIVHHPLLAEAQIADRDRLEPVRRDFEAKGLLVLSRIVGAVYGLGGRVVDNRRELLLAASDGSEEGARRSADELRARLGARPAIHSEVVARPRGTLELHAEGGAPLGEADAALWVEVDGDLGFVVEGVEHERSPTARAREDRAYHGRLYVTLDARGALAAVHGVSLEELLRAIVPSEMPASSHVEALKAQAVTARSNVLAQIGTRHLTDPFMLCAEVHCQAYRGDAARTARTDEAVRATRGEALFGGADRTLVDAVYSAMCGGHGEDADQVWGNAPNPSLRGRPDLPSGPGARWSRALRDEATLRAFLVAAPDAYCKRPAAARKDRFRWERRFSGGELDAALAPLGVGRVRRVSVGARGVSGRARVLEVEGEAGRAEVQGELRIRRLLGNLPSAMFVLDHEAGATVLRGGGWGHGAGMCQWGAVGRAEAGQGYREILRAYFSGAEVARVY